MALARMAAIRKGLDEGDPLVTVASVGVAGALVFIALSRGGAMGGGRGWPLVHFSTQRYTLFAGYARWSQFCQ